MKETTPIQVIRRYHRWSGLILIPLMTVKILSGFAAGGRIDMMSTEWAYRLHYTAWIDIPLMLGFILHAIYGIYKIIRPEGVKRIPVFHVSNLIAFVLFGILIIFVYFI